MTCEHGQEGYCWWCISLKNKPVEKQIDILKERYDCLLMVMKMLIRNMVHKKGPGANVVIGTITETINSSLISSGNDAAKPANGGGLAFYYATDTDVIYQRRSSDWIDISFSRPTSPDIRITDISTDSATGSLQVTDVT